MYLDYVGAIHFFKNRISPSEMFTQIIEMVIVSSLGLILFLLNPIFLYIDTENGKIIFKNMVGVKKIFSLNSLQGYIDTNTKSGFGSFHTFYLIKNNRVIKRIPCSLYSNVDEIQNGLKSIQYLGFRKRTLFFSLQVFFKTNIF